MVYVFCSIRLVEKPILENKINRGNSVPPADLFSLRIVTATVRDRDLIDPVSCLSDLGSELGLETKTILPHLDSLENVSPEDFITCLHVSKIESSQHIREGGQQFVSYRVPKEKDSVWTTEKTGTVDNISFILQDGLDEDRVFTGIVF